MTKKSSRTAPALDQGSATLVLQVRCPATIRCVPGPTHLNKISESLPHFLAEVCLSRDASKSWTPGLHWTLSTIITEFLIDYMSSLLNLLWSTYWYRLFQVDTLQRLTWLAQLLPFSLWLLTAMSRPIQCISVPQAWLLWWKATCWCILLFFGLLCFTFRLPRETYSHIYLCSKGINGAWWCKPLKRCLDSLKNDLFLKQ